MSDRDNFNRDVINLVSQRAGYCCSNPDCRKPTLSACKEDPQKPSNVSIVAHIKAASERGPRYDKEQSSEERSSAGNAIFLCCQCATMIDKNKGVDYETSLLQQWKREHEAWTRSRTGNLTCVEITLDNTGGAFPVADVRLVNNGAETVFLTRGSVETLDRIVFPTNASALHVAADWTYDVEFGPLAGDEREFAFSQAIKAGDAARFQLRFKGEPTSEGVNLNLYRLRVKLTQGDGGAVNIELPQLLLHMPREGKVAGRSQLPYSANEIAEMLKEIRNKANATFMQLAELVGNRQLCVDEAVTRDLERLYSQSSE